MMVAKLVRKAAGRQDPAILGAIKNGDGGAQHKLQVHSPEGVYVGKIVFGLWRAHGGPGCSAEEPMAKRSRGEVTVRAGAQGPPHFLVSPLQSRVDAPFLVVCLG